MCGPDGRNAVLSGLDLTVADGELLTVVGPGKSTLIRALAGLAEVIDGSLLIDGEPATDWIPADRGFAVVFQDHAPYPHLSVRDNLALPLRMARRPWARPVEETAAELGLTVHLDRRPSQLTGRQRQAMAVGRVLVRPEPAAYLLDEPAPNDGELRTRLRQRTAGTTTIWACAEPAEAAALGDRVAVLRAGRLDQIGTPRELAEAPANLTIARLAPLTLLSGPVEDGQVRLPIGSLPAPPGLDEVLVGIRPVDLTEEGDGLRIVALVGDGAEPDGTARLRHPAAARAAAEDPRLSPDLLARVDPAGRRTVTLHLDPARALYFDPGTEARV